MRKLTVTIEDQIFHVELDALQTDGDALQVRVNGQTLRVVVPESGAEPDEMSWIIVEDRPYEIGMDRNLQWIQVPPSVYRLEVREVEASLSEHRNGNGRIKAPIPGQISQVMVSPGQGVAAGQPLVVLEAMKMANEIRAPFSGVVQSVEVTPGSRVGRGDLLVQIA